MKVDFVVRSDGLEKLGGDSRQVAEYSRYLELLGYEVHVRPFVPGMRFPQRTIVHAVNVDRPFDFLATKRAAKGRDFVVSPIHHDLRAVRAMRKAETGEGLRSLVGRILPEAGREYLAFVIRTLRSHETVPGPRLLASIARAALDLPRVWSAVGKVLDDADAVTVLALGEERSLRRDTGWKKNNQRLIPNGISMLECDDESVVEQIWGDRPCGIVVAGRIEPRKRQLEVAVEAIRLGISVVFIGPLSNSASNYGKSFVELVRSGPGLTWKGGLPHEEVLRNLGTAKVLLNASWVEVQSLVDLEAAFSNCYVVAASTGNSKEWLPSHVTEKDPGGIGDMLAAASNLAALNTGPGLPSYNFTWKEAGQRLHSVYTTVRGAP